jgi:predicted outer membrane repeat protein
MICCALAGAGLLPAQTARAEPDAPAISATVQPPCDTASFDAAWNFIHIGLGGTLTFNCGNAPLLIKMSGTKIITKQVTINGGANIVLSGNLKHRHFVVNAGAALTLTNITIADGGGGFSLDAGGAVQNFGTLTVLSSTFTTNQTGSRYGGGAIYTRGELRVENSTFRNNIAGIGGAIFNESIGGSRGSASVFASSFVSNTASNTSGGGIYNSASLDLERVTLQGNRLTNGGSGGGVFNIGHLRVFDGVISQNFGVNGGGIYNRGNAELNGVVIKGNRAVDGAGFINVLSENDFIPCFTSMRDVTVIENRADENGGGVKSNEKCTLDISNSTIISNTADDTGGGMFLTTSTHVWNSTIAHNRASVFGGGIFGGGPVRLTNVTLIANQVPRAGSGGGLLGSGPFTVVNTIIAGNLAANGAGNNCAVGSLNATNSLSSDNTCPFLGPSNKLNTDPMLNPLGDYGGPTLTYLPKAGSPAIDGVIGSNAPATDQRGFPRPVGAGYDIGAVEVQPPAPPPPPPPPPNSIVPRVRIPIVLR